MSSAELFFYPECKAYINILRKNILLDVWTIIANHLDETDKEIIIATHHENMPI